MANKRNYAKELNTLIETFTHEEKRPTLLLHACCAPCSSAVLEKLTAHFKITVLFYNPNIYPEAEYHIPEGGERCFACYKLRMEAAAKYAAGHHFDFFTTTLSISPLKNAQKLNEIGEALAEEYGVPHLPSDFKKQEGYKRSIQLSADYNLYRQDFCGCVFSKKEREAKAHGEA